MRGGIGILSGFPAHSLCLVQRFAYCLKQLIHSVPQAFMLRFLQAGVGF